MHNKTPYYTLSVKFSKLSHVENPLLAQIVRYPCYLPSTCSAKLTHPHEVLPKVLPRFFPGQASPFHPGRIPPPSHPTMAEKVAWYLKPDPSDTLDGASKKQPSRCTITVWSLHLAPFHFPPNFPDMRRKWTKITKGSLLRDTGSLKCRSLLMCVWLHWAVTWLFGEQSNRRTYEELWNIY